MAQEHLNMFWVLFTRPPDQREVGDSPQEYLRKLNDLCGLKLIWPKKYPTGQLGRKELRNLCGDKDVDVLIGYAAVMAWGGRGVDSKNYCLSLTSESRKGLVGILLHLRGSRENREADFDAMQRSAEDIKGLGISFYTKLLFFFRKEADAYILDQFTAKSACILFENCPIDLTSSGYPDPATKPSSYEWFCAALETLANKATHQAGWSGELIEQAMFDVRGGKWRTYLRSIYGNEGNGKTGERPISAKSLTGCHRLGSVIAEAHAKAFENGCELPSSSAIVWASTPVRVYCCNRKGVSWQYDVQQASIHAKVFIPKQYRDRYDALRRHLDVKGHDFGDGIIGTGSKNGDTRSLKLTVRPGAGAPEREWGKIAKKAVSEMNRLFNRVCEFI
jgi:hypothetical protein